MNVAPEGLWDHVTDIFPCPRTSLDKNSLTLTGRWSGSRIGYRGSHHKIGIGCLAQINIGEETSVTANRYLATNCEERLEKWEADNPGAGISYSGINQFIKRIIVGFDIIYMSRLSC